MKFFYTIFNYILLVILFSCSGNKGNSEPAEPEQLNQTAAVTESKEGENLYLKYCMACHQTNGSGVPGMYPPLTNSPIVNSGKKEDFIEILLNGLKGPIEVHGKKYNQQMPSHNFLSDNELALIINYVAKSFENNAPEVTPSDVKDLRNTSSK